ncbi:copper chaperone PCu(A)C [Neoasaia chiangmaiensis]|nr:copper chaperone PCu(A)C [Neoasaia chiangmaiensis]
MQGFRNFSSMARGAAGITLLCVIAGANIQRADAAQEPMSADNMNADVPGQKDAAHDISVSGWIRYGQHRHDIGAAFFTITNNGHENHLLTNVSTPACGSLVIRHTDQEANSQTDVLFTHLALPHQVTMVFPEGGYHLVCREIKQDMQVGDKTPFTFYFLGGSSTTVQFEVRGH